MKYGNEHFLELPRSIFDEQYDNISIGAKWLYVWLKELEQRYCSVKYDFFLHTDEQLAKELHCDIKTLKKYKAELKKTGLIEFKRGRFVSKSGKKSIGNPTSYKIY